MGWYICASCCAEVDGLCVRLCLCVHLCVAVTGVVCACDSLCMCGVHVGVGDVVVDRSGYLDVAT